MRRGVLATVVAVTASVAALAASVAPAGAIQSTSNTNKTVTCTVEARQPTFTRTVTGAVSVTGAYRLACTRTSTSISSVNVSISVGAVELDADRLGKFTVIDSKLQLADYSPLPVTFKFGSYSYLDLTTKSFTCVNTDTATNDNEEIATRVKISLVSGKFSLVDVSTASYLSAPC